VIEPDSPSPGPEAEHVSSTAQTRLRTPALIAVFLLLLIVVCAVRAPAFFWSVINWDESIYLLISREMLEGDVLYTGIWDRKQPLTFVIFALSQLVFGKTILSIRILGCLSVAGTCLGLYFIGRRTFGETRAGPMVAAGLYAFFSISSGGLATNTEILFAPLIVGAVALILPWWVGRNPSSALPTSSCFGSGLLIGLASFTKLIAVFDGAFVVLLLVTGWMMRPRENEHRPPVDGLVRRLAALALGAATPWVAGTIYFWSAGALGDFVFANFTFNRMNLADRPPFSLLNIWLVIERLVTTENGLLWIGLGAGIVVLIVRPKWLIPRDRRLLAALSIWALIGTAAAVSLRRLYLHYYLQPTPALALIGGFFFVRLWALGKRVPAPLKVAVALALLIPQGLRIVERWRQIGEMVDVPAVVSAYVGDRVEPGDFIYVANYQPIIYYITKTRSPTRWAFPQFLISPVFRHRLGIDLEQEMVSIFSHAPRYVVFNTREEGLVDPAYHRVLFERFLDVDYELEIQLLDVALFRRLPARPPPILNDRIDPKDGSGSRH